LRAKPWRWLFLRVPRERASALEPRRHALRDTMNLQAEASSLKKGESLLDTVHTPHAMKPDLPVMRHALRCCGLCCAEFGIPGINAGDGTHETSFAGRAGRAHNPRAEGSDR